MLGVQHWTVQTCIGCVVKYEQSAPLTESPIVFKNHVAFPFTQTSGRLQEPVVTSLILVSVIMLEFQLFIEILFTSYQLLDGRDIERLEVKRVLLDGTVKSRLFHQCYHQPIGNLGMERIVTLKMTVVIGVRVGTNLSLHRGVSSYFSTFQVRDDLSMN